MISCWHWCRGGAGHDWCHPITEKEAGSPIDSFRLFCPEHGAEMASQILDGGTENDANTSREQRRQAHLAEQSFDAEALSCWRASNRVALAGEEETVGSVGRTLALVFERQEAELSIL